MDWALNMQCCATINEIVKHDLPSVQTNYGEVANAQTADHASKRAKRRHKDSSKNRDTRPHHRRSADERQRAGESKRRRKHKRRPREGDEDQVATIEIR